MVANDDINKFHWRNIRTFWLEENLWKSTKHARNFQHLRHRLICWLNKVKQRLHKQRTIVISEWYFKRIVSLGLAKAYFHGLMAYIEGYSRSFGNVVWKKITSSKQFYV